MATATTEATKPLKPRVTDKEAKRAKQFDGKAIGAKLKELRESLRIEGADMKTVGLTPQRVASIEKDAKDVTLTELQQLASAYQYTIGGLISRVAKGNVGEL